MTLDHYKVKNWRFGEIEHEYTPRDTILYALGAGLGHDPLDERQLRYVYERGLFALPTMASVLGYPGFWVRNPETGIDWVTLVLSTRPTPPAAAACARASPLLPPPPRTRRRW